MKKERIKRAISTFIGKVGILWLGTGLLLTSCNGDNTPDCFQNAGNIVQKEVSLPQFSKITVFEKIELVLKQGDHQKVTIETGEFLIDEVSVKVEGDRLLLYNQNGCNLFREYGITKVYVTAPNLSEIRSSTGRPIWSEGLLQYPDLSLLSESFAEPEAETTDGSFDLQLDAQTITITTNGIAYFKLGGTVENLQIAVAAGDSRIEAENLSAANVSINHRGSNDILVNPQESLSGVIRGTGDVISHTRPSNIEVEELFSGRLIFKE